MAAVTSPWRRPLLYARVPFIAVILVLLLIPTCIFAIVLCRVANITDKQERIAYQQWLDSRESKINRKD